MSVTYQIGKTMTINSITATVDSALPTGAQSRYPREYDALIAALTEREYQITEAVAAKVSERFGVSEEQVLDRATAIGLSVRPAPEPEPEPEPEAPESDKSIDERVASLEGSIGALVDAVAQLTALANKHLGSRA
jgi:hypothetical protein